MHFHELNSVSEPPLRLNNPFGYEAHALCREAARQVMDYVGGEPLLQADAAHGKMLGVLVVRQPCGRVGFLAAYSGLLAGRNDWPYFVPPVFDAQQPDGHFKQTEAYISSLNARLDSGSLTEAEAQVLRQERRQLSEALQLWLFGQYRVLNGRGEQKDLIAIWRDYHQSERLRQRYPLPPGGSGDCCGPKLLQHAYEHGLQPLQIAEFWYGESPRGEVRHHGQFYPACRGKCRPILSFMLQGLDVEPESAAALSGEQAGKALRVVYADEQLLVVAKPSGLLSVPGRIDAPSVASLLADRYGRVLLPHRLDMDTSGLMVVARTDEAYKHLQRQFYARTIYKRYVALLETPGAESPAAPLLEVGSQGIVALPLRPDPLDRPRQVVDHLHGKAAETHYEVLALLPSGRTLVALTPRTGRTHQLRLHCAHAEGLGRPIVGDNLYGQAGVRLCLHAAGLCFQHPVTGRQLAFSEPYDFGEQGD